MLNAVVCHKIRHRIYESEHLAKLSYYHVLQISNHVKRFVEFQTPLLIYENGLYMLNKSRLHENWIFLMPATGSE